MLPSAYTSLENATCTVGPGSQEATIAIDASEMGLSKIVEPKKWNKHEHNMVMSCSYHGHF